STCRSGEEIAPLGLGIERGDVTPCRCQPQNIILLHQRCRGAQASRCGQPCRRKVRERGEGRPCARELAMGFCQIGLHFRKLTFRPHSVEPGGFALFLSSAQGFDQVDEPGAAAFDDILALLGEQQVDEALADFRLKRGTFFLRARPPWPRNGPFGPHPSRSRAGPSKERSATRWRTVPRLRRIPLERRRIPDWTKCRWLLSRRSPGHSPAASRGPAERAPPRAATLLPR